MDEEEHEVYGQEIPVDGDMDGADVDMTSGGDSAAKLQELDEMKRRLKEMEEEAAALRDMQAKVAKEMQGGDPSASTAEAKEQVDSRSVYVGNVDYACTPEEVQQHFQACGTVNRVTILTDKFGQPKGFAYVEFLEQEAVQEALNLNESELHGRQIKVAPKRTNVPGMKQRPPRGYNPYHGYPYRSYGAPYFPPKPTGTPRPRSPNSSEAAKNLGLVLSRRELAAAALSTAILSRVLPAVAEAAGGECPLEVATSGLAFCDRVVGTGAAAEQGQLIKAHYTGRLEDGTVFDSSYKRGKPLTFRVGVGEVIKGWDQGIVGGEGIPPMLPGGKRTLKLPPELAYGARGAGCRGWEPTSCVIPPNSTLLFDVEYVGRAF